MRLHMTANHLAWAKFSPITDSAQVRELLSQSKNMLIVGIHRAIAAANSETVEEIDDLPAACGRVLTENTAEIDAITSSLNMLPFIDPTFQSIDPKCPLIAPELKLAMIHSSMSPTVITYESDTSRDPPEDHWLTQQQRDLVREGEWNQLAGDAVLVAAGKGKDLFVQINKSIKIPKSKTSWIAKEFINRIEAELACAETSTQTGIDKLAKLAAKGLMSLRRVCTSYEKPWDESSSCNVEERLALLMKLLNKKTNGKAKQLVDVAFNELKSEYSDAQWRDMAKQRGAWVDKSGRNRPRDAINFAHKTGVCNDANCTDSHETFSFVDVLTDGHDAETCKAILSLAKAPPSTIGMAQAVKLSGVEILWRMHCILGHAPLDQVLATLAKTEGLRAGVVTKSDIETFVKLGCQQCIIWKMRRTPIRSLADKTPAPPGKKWAYDTLTLKVKTAAGHIYLTRFLDDGSGFKRTYGHADFTSETLQKIMAMHRAWVRPTHGEIWIGKRDNHPSQAAKSFQDMLSVAQVHDQATAPYQHESMPVEVTWQHDVPCAMALLATGLGAKALRHFEAAFLTHEDSSNRTVKPRAHNGAALSAHMIYFDESVARVNLLFAFFAPLMYLVFPEVRDNKFTEHALPGAYYGPSRSTESDNYCDVWNGTRFFAVHKGSLRIDERRVLAASSRTNKTAQPFTKESDADPAPDLPNFDQWTNPALEKPISQQSTPAIIETELDGDLTPGDPDPTIPFILFLHAGHRRLGEFGHYVKRLTKGKARVVAVDTKRRGYSHNVLLPRVFAWLKRLCALAVCIAILISAPCSPFAPMRLDQSTQGPPVLFNRANPDGVKLANGDVHPLAEGALRLHKQGFELAHDVHKRGGGVVIEHPVNHGADSMWPIKGREEHSTLFETTLFRDFAKNVPGERVISDQCAAGAPTRKTTQWYCNEHMLAPMFKYLGVLHCPERETPDHPWPHSKTLVGKNDAGEWNSEGSDEYTTTLSGLLALAFTEGKDFVQLAQPASDVFDEFASIASTPPAGPSTDPAAGGGDGNVENLCEECADDDDEDERSGADEQVAEKTDSGDESEPENPDAPDTAYEQRIL